MRECIRFGISFHLPYLIPHFGSNIIGNPDLTDIASNLHAYDVYLRIRLRRFLCCLSIRLDCFSRCLRMKASPGTLNLRRHQVSAVTKKRRLVNGIAHPDGIPANIPIIVMMQLYVIASFREPGDILVLIEAVHVLENSVAVIADLLSVFGCPLLGLNPSPFSGDLVSGKYCS